MTVFVDTSAFYAVFDADDAHHASAKTLWERLLAEPASLATNNYVVLETTALLQNRLGLAAVRAFYDDVMPLLTVHWISADTHGRGAEVMLAAGRRKLSLVDCASFHTMRDHGIRVTFCFDDHYLEQGFTLYT